MRPLILLVLFLASLPSHARAASVTYSAAIDTSALAGTTGSLDFNFEPGPFGSQPANVGILSFSGNGSPSGSPTMSGDASGSLPGDLLLDNGTGFNDYFQAFTFGSSVSFDIVLGGAALDSPTGYGSGSTFAFSIFSDMDGTMPALTSDMVNGYAITVDINPDGSTTFRNYTNSPTSITPELPTGALVTTASIVAGLLKRRRVRGQRT